MTVQFAARGDFNVPSDIGAVLTLSDLYRGGGFVFGTTSGGGGGGGGGRGGGRGAISR